MLASWRREQRRERRTSASAASQLPCDGLEGGREGKKDGRKTCEWMAHTIYTFPSFSLSHPSIPPSFST